LNRADLQTLSELRIREAVALLSSTPPLPDGAYYLAGYSVECALKAAIAKLNSQFDWPEKAFVADCHTHNILALVRLARLESARAIDAASNRVFAQNWLIVNDWNEHSRYRRNSLIEARQIIDAVMDATNGVLPWIKARW
jgi:hypothetical protein